METKSNLRDSTFVITPSSEFESLLPIFLS
jgi:hypothetical protein